MIKTAGFVIAALVFASAAAADPIFPRMLEGKYSFGVMTAQVALDANGVPTMTPTRSIGILRVDVAEPTVLLCAEVPAPGGLGETVPVVVDVPVVGDRAELRAVAYAGAGCTGKESDPSDNGAYVFFLPPGPPELRPE